MHYDIIIIGAGPGGYETAAEAAALGHKVALIERDRLGGTCLNRGCIPTKCLCAVAEQLLSVSQPLPGIKTTVEADYTAAHARIAPIVEELTDGIVQMLEGVDIIKGEAALAGNDCVSVNGKLLNADKIIIATGSAPASLRIPGAEHAMDSNTFLALNKLPEHLTIIGGGVIGLEFASIAATFGSKVTVVEFCKEILPGIDADIAKRLRSALTKRGIDIITDACVKEIAADYSVTYERRGKTAPVSSDAILMAVGRRPVVPSGLDKAGVATNARGYITVDDNMATTAPGIFAIGDVNGLSMLAHSAAAQGRRALELPVDLSVVPSIVFTVPQLASVKRTETDITETAKTPYSSIGYALAAGFEGILKLGYNPQNGQITSCTALGPHAADLVAQAATAINAHNTVDQFSQSIAAHPSMSEILTTTAAKLLNNNK